MKVIVPGLHNSGQEHWQTHFQQSDPKAFVRIDQENWDQPDCETWIRKMENDLKEFKYNELILIGHSIGCMAIVKWYERFKHLVKGALLVAPSDSEKDTYPKYITGFNPIPTNKLPFPSIVVASNNDHVTSLSRSVEFAKNWGSEIVIMQNAGHIEPARGFGEWTQGLELLKRLESL